MRIRLKCDTCVLLLAGLLAGCGQKEQSTPAPSGTREPASGQGAVETAKQAADTATAEAKKAADTAQKTVDQATAQAQILIDQTKTFLSQNKYQDALAGMQKLRGLTLSAEQQKLVSDLKTQVQKLGGDIEKGIGDLRTLVSEKKYTDATAMVSKLTNYQLTPDQQKLVDDLKAQLQKALGGQAADEGKKALGGLLPPK
jgi:hypothetical protein